MNKKVYKTLEYNKILTMLSSYAACDETKKRCLSLEPITDLYEIRHLQTTTADALSRLYKDSGVSFVGIHNVHASLKRLVYRWCTEYDRASSHLQSFGGCKAREGLWQKRHG